MSDLLSPDRVAIRVTGKPIPQGSKRIARRGKKTFLLDNNEKTLAPWRAHVTAHATGVFHHHDQLFGPVRVWLRFAFDRPTSHYGTGRNADRLRTTAPAYPGHGCGDIDKLTRAVLDALTDAGVWGDDTQVVDVRARKFYAGEHELAPDRAGVDIVLEECP